MRELEILRTFTNRHIRYNVPNRTRIWAIQRITSGLFWSEADLWTIIPVSGNHFDRSHHMEHRSENSPVCTLVIPTYNASAFIARSVARIRDFLDAQPAFCVLFVCDGCTDDTAAKLQTLVKDHPRISVHVYTRNRGKGYAIKRGLWRAQTPYRIFTDVDLAYPPEEATRVLALLQSGADMVVVNRAHPESKFLISPMDFPYIYKRHRMSRAFNAFLRFMLPIRILDTQAGLKGFTAGAWEKIGPRVLANGFFFDVEVLAYAGDAKLRIDETPVHFEYVDPSTVKLVAHGWSMILDTLRLRHRLRSARRGIRKGVLSLGSVDEAPLPSAPSIYSCETDCDSR
jgi:dolichyl-phosphate beta-glucosyltransferase